LETIECESDIKMENVKQIKPITQKDFREEVIEEALLVIVQFKAQWSGSCALINPIVEDIALHYKDDIKILSVDFDEEEELIKEFTIVDLPTFLFFKKGKLVDHIIGAVPRSHILRRIETHKI
jgi:thioredoxin 1